MDEIYNISFRWIYDEKSFNMNSNIIRPHRPKVVEIPQNIINVAEKIKTINGTESLQGTANIYHTLSHLPLPIPSFTRFIPAVYAYWNAVKGGSDTTTKLMDDRLLVLPYTNCETAATNRCIFVLFALCHRLFQIFSAKKDLNYPSLQHYRNAASKRFTFFKTLLRCQLFFHDEILLINQRQRERENNENSLTDPTPQQRRRVQPNRRVIDGAPLQQVNFAPSLPTITPKKTSKKVLNGTASAQLTKLVQNCTGMPMKVYRGAIQQRCEICKSKTSWYCAGCKRFFCIDKKMSDKVVHQNKEAKRKNEPLIFDIYTHKVKGNSVQFLKVCYHRAHEAAWCKPCEDN